MDNLHGDDMRKVWILLIVVISLSVACGGNGPMGPEDDDMMDDPMMDTAQRG
jgi:hypothetical protein